MTTLPGLLVDLMPVTGAFRNGLWLEAHANDDRLLATGGENIPIARVQLDRQIEQQEAPSSVRFMIQAKDGVAIGTLALYRMEPTNRMAHLGMWIMDATYQCGGHGTDALLLVAQYVFDWLDLRRIMLHTMATNTGMQRCAERCGFQREAIQHQVVYALGEWVDVWTYGLLRDQWHGRAALVEALGLRDKAHTRYGRMTTSC